jgi:hypothetical protein
MCILVLRLYLGPELGLKFTGSLNLGLFPGVVLGLGSGLGSKQVLGLVGLGLDLHHEMGLGLIGGFYELL